MRIHEEQHSAVWDEKILQSQHPSFLQSWDWGEFQKAVGRNVHRLCVLQEDEEVAWAQVIMMPGRFGQSYAYCPRGPVALSATADHEKVMMTLEKYFQESIKPCPIFLRYDPVDVWPHPRARRGPMMQPWATRLVDLTSNEEALLANMKSGTRYNIRLAERHGVMIKKVTDIPDATDRFWHLLSETAQRQNIHTHPASYFQSMVKVLTPTGKFHLYEAWYQQELLSSLWLMEFGDTITNLHSASSSKNRKVKSADLLRWRVMQEAKQRGRRFYDLYGVAATPEQEKKWEGITKFKEGFGGVTIRYEKTQEIPLKKGAYRLYRLLKRA